MVKRAFSLLIEEGKEPAIAAGEKTAVDNTDEDGRKLNDDGSVNLFSGISACTKDGHVHVQCDPGFISQLLLLAEPELSGLKQERHAKTIEIAQKEVLICIGITLFNRFHRIQQKLK
ncbi:gametogenetin-binding protein 2 [Eurytemora carolleeae]|uniref:gametogenetin-binding protein 2 n=1 Tax=Eurytemora carolleeae TaxID=1294199 RepID=UPI000C77E32B|nr:gametogenetin-binding protein 2 [Eurytemora carolleeae]|eukprot:XP_023322686.1 gametogenetin-binding protein 2-like [Eurytemora affinis]